MELTGKTLKDFWIWYLLPEQQKEYKTKSLIKFGNENSAKVRFLAMSFTERYGVYVDFFESEGLNLFINYSEGYAIGSKVGFYYTIDYMSFESSKSTRKEARESAIKKVNEIYNNK